MAVVSCQATNIMDVHVTAYAALYAAMRLTYDRIKQHLLQLYWHRRQWPPLPEYANMAAEDTPRRGLPPTLLDLLSTPGVGAQVFGLLQDGRRISAAQSLRQCCRVLRDLVSLLSKPQKVM
jgi:hypothetical protein